MGLWDGLQIAAIALLASNLTACSSTLNEYHCQTTEDCRSTDDTGVCESAGFCSFADPSCPEERSYGKLAGELSGTCVSAQDAGIVRIDGAIDDASLNAPDAVGKADGAPTFAQFININGPDHSGSDYPGSWEADSGDNGVCDGIEYFADGNIAGTVDDALFRGSMFTTSGNNLECSVPSIPAGIYSVTLLFGETYRGPECPGGGGEGSRVFNIIAEGVPLESGFDIFAEGGCIAEGSEGTPVTRQYNVVIGDGTLDLVLETDASAMISAISVKSVLSQ